MTSEPKKLYTLDIFERDGVVYAQLHRPDGWSSRVLPVNNFMRKGLKDIRGHLALYPFK